MTRQSLIILISVKRPLFSNRPLSRVDTRPQLPRKQKDKNGKIRGGAHQTDAESKKKRKNKGNMCEKTKFGKEENIKKKDGKKK